MEFQPGGDIDRGSGQYETVECEVWSRRTENDPGKGGEKQGDHCVVCRYPQVSCFKESTEMTLCDHLLSLDQVKYL
jgi:hypothetical protein